MQEWIITALPYLVLSGVWLYFTRNFMGPKSKYTAVVEAQRQQMERIERQLDRIATALEKK